MSQLAILEKHDGKDLERFQKSFRSDYVGIPMLKNALRITAVFLLLLLIWGSGRIEWLLDVIAQGQSALLLTGVLAAYATLLLVTLMITFLAASASYFRVRQKAEAYQALLQELMTENMEGNDESV